jgi:hypothetical protein
VRIDFMTNAPRRSHRDLAVDAYWRVASSSTSTMSSSIELINPKAESVRRQQALQVNINMWLGCCS